MKAAWHAQFKQAPRALRITHDGLLFHSILEKRRWENLRLMWLAGEISDLRRQVPFPLVLPNGEAVKTPSGQTMRYISDFVYKNKAGEEIIEDCKGSDRDKYSFLKIAIFEAIYGRKVVIYGIKPKKAAEKKVLAKAIINRYTDSGSTNQRR